MNRSIIALAGLLLTTACATQPQQSAMWTPIPPPVTKATALSECRDAAFLDKRNIDPFYLANGGNPVTPDGDTPGLTLRGHVFFLDCMESQGYEAREGNS